jgi:hypothetical protein
MNTLSIVIATLVVLTALGAVLWARRTVQRAESDLLVEAGLQNADFDIGTWTHTHRSKAT